MKSKFNGKAMAYWVCTAILAFCIGSGGIAEFLQLPGNVEGIVHVLGYPLYFVSMLGFCKILGVIVLLAPGFPRLKEWAYAGIFFNVTCAVASHAAIGDYGAYAFHILVNLFFAVLVIASWALRPPSRILGVLLPAGFPQQAANA